MNGFELRTNFGDERIVAASGLYFEVGIEDSGAIADGFADLAKCFFAGNSFKREFHVFDKVTVSTDCEGM